ncbi:endonuclease/exonuclease/phosphatase family protein [Haloferula rosea]|uniref:Endonuclease/exonuclease/phosphatase domain-containing protein n=1 Tax=Haloferula rosea TaxID=490093 RepID=A0A934RAE2_9BACT|nr:endonuclease/exonuclease/phosphatase family protein [Haloferula rosea]MBK1826885.1 hypothetical protein [Haloferula rosea]
MNRGSRSRKLPQLAALQSTVLALQEIGKPEEPVQSEIWTGEKDNQGVSVKAAEGIEVRLDETYSPDFPDTLPTVLNEKFQVLAIWSKPRKTYVQNVLSILDQFEEFIHRRPTVVLGDFNANPTFDAGNAKHSKFHHIEERMNAVGLISAYHQYFGEPFGAESRASIYWMWKENKPFHIDYVFVPKTWSHHITRVDVGDYNSWKSLSDHRPLSVELGTLPAEAWL